MSDKYAALKLRIEKALEDFTNGRASMHVPVLDTDVDLVLYDCLDLLAEREADKARIAELSESHSKLRDTIAAIHNTIRMDGGYTPLAAIINAARRAHEESAVVAAGITLETGE